MILPISAESNLMCGRAILSRRELEVDTKTSATFREKRRAEDTFKYASSDAAEYATPVAGSTSSDQRHGASHEDASVSEFQ